MCGGEQGDRPALTQGSLTDQPRVDKALSWAAQTLAAVTDRPHLEAELLLVNIRECTRVALFAHPEARLAPEQAQQYTQSIHRRASGVPLPYITGHIEFSGLRFDVTPAVLIPRPETELLVEHALAWIQRHQVRRMVDVGTGSGCIAVTLTVQGQHRHVIAGDISSAALAVAQANAQRHRVASQITFVQADLLAPYAAPRDGLFDLIVSNPPYVADPEWDRLPESVRQEPRSALLAGPQGLNLIERLLIQARRRLAPSGCMLVEIGEKQRNAVQALAQTAFPKAHVLVLPDLAGKPRLLEVVLP